MSNTHPYTHTCTYYNSLQWTKSKTEPQSCMGQGKGRALSCHLYSHLHPCQSLRQSPQCSWTSFSSSSCPGPEKTRHPCQSLRLHQPSGLNHPPATLQTVKSLTKSQKLSGFKKNFFFLNICCPKK